MRGKNWSNRGLGKPIATGITITTTILVGAMTSTRSTAQTQPQAYQTVATSTLEKLQKMAATASRSEARLRFLNLQHLPLSCTDEEGGWLLGFNEEEIAILRASAHLPKLGHPAPNGKKKLSTEALLSAGANPEWLADAHEIIRKHWLTKNSHIQQQTKPTNRKKTP